MGILLMLLKYVGLTIFVLFSMGVLMLVLFTICIVLSKIHQHFKGTDEEIDNSDQHVWCELSDKPCIKSTINTSCLQKECQSCPVVFQKLLEEQLDKEFDEE